LPPCTCDESPTTGKIVSARNYRVNDPMPIEKHFNIPFISSLALREKQIQQNYRPIIPQFLCAITTP